MMMIKRSIFVILVARVNEKKKDENALRDLKGEPMVSPSKDRLWEGIRKRLAPWNTQSQKKNNKKKHDSKQSDEFQA